MRITETSHTSMDKMTTDQLLDWYSDLYKSSMGTRPHFDPSAYTREEIISMIKELLGEKDPRMGESINLLKKLVKEEVRRITSK